MSPSFGVLMLVASVAAPGATLARADQSDSPAPGRRILVTASGLSDQPLIGDLVAIEATRVTVRRIGSSEVVVVPRNAIVRFEVATERRQRGRSARIGSLVGLGLGAAIGAAAGDDCGGSDAPIICISRPAAAFGVGLAGAGAGALLGLILAPRHTVWEAVDPAGFKVAVAPSPVRGGGLGLAIALSF